MKNFFLFCIFSFCFVFSAPPVNKKKKTVCLNMIVKDETKVIKRCLASVKPIIDYWVICDTGSTDGTQQMIKDFMKDIPGELIEEPWQNFEYNRNHALTSAKGKGDYLLFIDADEELLYDEGFKLPALKEDFYFITSDYAGSRYERTQLINNHLNWRWEGVVHEIVRCEDAKSCAIMPNVRNFIRAHEGNRSADPLKYEKDAAILEKAMLKEPNNSRYQFYLAQSYRDCAQYEKSIENYDKRIRMGGWDQEIFWSIYQIAKMQQILNKPSDTYMQNYYKAFAYRSTRAEPLYYIAQNLRNQKKFHEAYAITSLALRMPMPDDILFIENWIYEWGLLMEHSVSAFWIGNYSEALNASITLLQCNSLPEQVKGRAMENMKWIQKEIEKLQTEQQQSNQAKAQLNIQKKAS